jgi:hypothetical protein
MVHLIQNRNLSPKFRKGASVMKKRKLYSFLFVAAAAISGMASPASADFFSIAPNGTYLRADASDSVSNPAIINLSALTTPVHPGDTILIQRVGAIKFAINSTDSGTQMGAVFSSTNAFLSQTNLNRVPGAIDAGTDFTTPNTFSGNLPTDITQDFEVDDAVAGTNRTFSSVTITVPTGANFLFVGVIDNLYSDNSDPNSDFGVTVTLVPEPASLALLGLGSLVMLRRSSRRK